MDYKKSSNYKRILSQEQKENRRRILEISYKLKLSHIGSCLSAIDLIDAVYKVKKNDEKFILSNGHAGIALYVILEKYGFIKDPRIFEKLYVHPDRNTDLGIYVSTGSLGQGLPIALGIALADRKKTVYCMISDGECAEGSIWEALRIIDDLRVVNLKVILNFNGWGGYDRIELKPLVKRLKAFDFILEIIDGYDIRPIVKVLKKTNYKPLIILAKTDSSEFPFLKAQDAHYYVMNEQDYLNALDLLLWS